jgi:(E)-4-hydroxy-3-methylbut-2-enyl-diphosphate synthase
MTSCLTSDPEAVTAQTLRCAEAALEIVRVTVQGLKQAKALGRMKAAGNTPTVGLVAVIHLKPSVALAVADHVDSPHQSRQFRRRREDI